MDELLFQAQQRLAGFLLMGHVARVDGLGFIIDGGFALPGWISVTIVSAGGGQQKTGKEKDREFYR